MGQRLERVRGRVRLLPPRVQQAIPWVGGAVGFVLATVVEESLHGTASTVYWVVATVCLVAVGVVVLFPRGRQ